MKLLKELLTETPVKFIPSKLKGFAKYNNVKLVKQGDLINLIDKDGNNVGVFNTKNDMIDTKLDTYKYIQF